MTLHCNTAFTAAYNRNIPNKDTSPRRRHHFDGVAVNDDAVIVYFVIPNVRRKLD